LDLIQSGKTRARIFRYLAFVSAHYANATLGAVERPPGRS
jgi:hypothetical protein